MPAYSLPTFNLTCRFQADPPPFGRGAAESLCNLAYGQRVNVASTGGTGEVGIPMILMTLLLPPLTDIRGPSPPNSNPNGANFNGYYVEVVIGSGRIYQVVFVDDIGKGFANEHRVALLQQFSQVFPLP
jgi:hypothetical protein